MPERDGYPDGVPSWVDYNATDLPSAKSFYTALFGWDAEEQVVDGELVYVLCRKDGKKVAGLAPMPPEMQQQGAPSVWGTYIAHSDTAKVAARAKELGATVIADDMEVMEEGRMTLIADPTGAMVGFWKEGLHRGAELVNEPGAMVWNELGTRDVDTARRFYGDLLGWEYATSQMGPTEYTEIKTGDGASIGGMMAVPDEAMPSYWAAYFGVENADDAAKQAVALGGSILVPVMEIPGGRFAFLTDPQGGVFAVMELSEPAS